MEIADRTQQNSVKADRTGFCSSVGDVLQPSKCFKGTVAFATIFATVSTSGTHFLITQGLYVIRALRFT